MCRALDPVVLAWCRWTAAFGPYRSGVMALGCSLLMLMLLLLLQDSCTGYSRLRVGMVLLQTQRT